MEKRKRKKKNNSEYELPGKLQTVEEREPEEKEAVPEVSK